jgi:hypothetical protein
MEGSAVTTKQAAELYARVGRAAPPEIAAPVGSKYGSRKKEVDGHLFDSTGEAEAYRYLKRDESAGIISKLELQPVYVLQHSFASGAAKHRAITYRADFRFIDCNGQTHVIDYKGFRTEVYKLKLKMFRALYHDIIFEEWDRAKLRELNRS